MHHHHLKKLSCVCTERDYFVKRRCISVLPEELRRGSMRPQKKGTFKTGEVCEEVS